MTAYQTEVLEAVKAALGRDTADAVAAIMQRVQLQMEDAAEAVAGPAVLEVPDYGTA